MTKTILFFTKRMTTVILRAFTRMLFLNGKKTTFVILAELPDGSPGRVPDEFENDQIDGRPPQSVIRGNATARGLPRKVVKSEHQKHTKSPLAHTRKNQSGASKRGCTWGS